MAPIRFTLAMKYGLAAAVVATPACAPGADESGDDAALDSDAPCGELECASGLRISLVAQSGSFAGGDYGVTVTADGEIESCGFKLARGFDGCGEARTCVVESNCAADFHFTVPPNAIVFMVSAPGGGPTEIDIDVARDRTSIAAASYFPSYDDYAPNGLDCLPVCQIAAAQLMVP